MGRILEMDDISKGMFLTVLRGSISNRIINGPQGPMAEIREDSRLNGKVLNVIAVDLPFIAVEFFYMNSSDKVKRDTLDIRDLVLGSLTTEYMAAAEPRWKIPLVTEFNRDPDWTYEEWQEQPVKKVVKRPKSYSDDELLNSL